ncbi:MAG: AAA family ATPase [Myxococcota bacterium]
MLTSVSLKNVRSWEDAEIPLSPLTVLVGPNACGKTTVLEALQFIARMTSTAHRWGGMSPGSHERLLRRGATRLEIATRGEVELALGVEKETITLDGLAPARFSFVHAESRDRLTGLGGNDSLFERFSFLRLLRLEGSRLAAPSYSDEPVPRVQEDGTHLATVLAYLKQEAPMVFRKIEDGLRRIVPRLEAIRAPRTKVVRDEVRTVIIDGTATSLREPRTYIGNELLFDMEGAPGIAADQAGEGTLLALGLLSALGGIDSPSIALLDDIDMRLHPRAQGELVAIIRAILASGTTTQFIGTTHSPFFLQHLQPHEVVVVDLTGNRSVARRLDEHPDYERWKDAMGVGEFWSWAGEAWTSR